MCLFVSFPSFSLSKKPPQGSPRRQKHLTMPLLSRSYTERNPSTRWSHTNSRCALCVSGYDTVMMTLQERINLKPLTTLLKIYQAYFCVRQQLKNQQHTPKSYSDKSRSSKMGCTPSRPQRPNPYTSCKPPNHRQALRERLQYVEPVPLVFGPPNQHKKSVRRKYENSPQYQQDLREAIARANYM